jgi:hypothetical protein
MKKLLALLAAVGAVVFFWRKKQGHDDWDTASDTASSWGDTAKDTATDTADDVAGKAEDVAGKAADAVDDVTS